MSDPLSGVGYIMYFPFLLVYCLDGICFALFFLLPDVGFCHLCFLDILVTTRYDHRKRREEYVSDILSFFFGFWPISPRVSALLLAC